jgi:hypothetical protein
VNRIEIVGLFTALSKLCQKKDIESIEEIVNAVLNEAISKKPAEKKVENTD